MKLQGLQRRLGGLVLILLWLGAMSVQSMAAAVASSEHFVVLAPTQRLADKAVGHADAFRAEIAREWLGKEFPPLPPAAPPVVISIAIDPDRSFARTLVDGKEGRHLMWLVGSERAVTEHLLRHEVAHTVLAARFGDTMPIWANEGIASRYDNPRRHELRNQQLQGFVEIDSWPPLTRLLDNSIRQPWEYAAAVSLTDYLISRGGREQFLTFVADGEERGWPQSLQSHYGYNSVSTLETDWRDAVRQEFAPGQQTPGYSRMAKTLAAPVAHQR